MLWEIMSVEGGVSGGRCQWREVSVEVGVSGGRCQWRKRTDSKGERTRPSNIQFLLNITKSGIGSCIAPKAGLARHPAKGRCSAEISGLNSSGV